MARHFLKIARAIRITIATIKRVNQPPLHGATVEWSLIWVLHAKTPKKSRVLGSLAIVRLFFPFRGVPALLSLYTRPWRSATLPRVESSLAAKLFFFLIKNRLEPL
jgi:hypothetical protein